MGNVRQRDIADLDLFVGPLYPVSLEHISRCSVSVLSCLVEQLDAANLVGDILGQDGVAGRALNLDFSVRHDCDWRWLVEGGGRRIRGCRLLEGKFVMFGRSKCDALLAYQPMAEMWGLAYSNTTNLPSASCVLCAVRKSISHKNISKYSKRKAH